MFAQPVEAAESDNVTRVFGKVQYTRCYQAWEDVTEQCMNDVCKKILKTYFDNFKGFDKDSAVDDTANKILLLNKQLNLVVEADDIRQRVSTKAEVLFSEAHIRSEEEKKKSL